MSDIGNGRAPVHAVTAVDLTAAAGAKPSADPRRWRSLATVALIVLALWGIGGLTVQSVRDHLA